ncbi:hypothetical protein Y032_0017g3475 [Ancylostoma ceylanicum]|uniref:Uncharacterized protein n=1 Tax=Ancylostoma ceylanicum TaxID=53326 RepID=A0A016V4R8_9BILA|nr:hypothetical protein Y032_0017g3475 [Ancylostoma ceylanicum]
MKTGQCEFTGVYKRKGGNDRFRQRLDGKRMRKEIMWTYSRGHHDPNVCSRSTAVTQPSPNAAAWRHG